MPPKKDGKKKKAKAPEFTDEDLDCFVKYYKNFCKDAGLPVYEPLVKQVTDEGRDLFKEDQQFILVPADPANPEEPRLGPGGCRAMCTAILATGPGMQKKKPEDPGGPFKALKAIRCWHSHIGDDGAWSLAEVLRLGGAEVKLEYLELWHNEIGPRGCRALGGALMIGGNKSLLALKLDYNPLGSEGLANLARGLRSNASLLQLHASYCQIDSLGCAALGDALSFDKLGLILLNLQGNSIGDEGLSLLCPGLAANNSLLNLNLADNQIGERRTVVKPMQDFAVVLTEHKTLATLNLDMNRLCAETADALLPGVSDGQDPTKPNKRLARVVVDAQLEEVKPELYDRLNVTGGGGKKGGKKGKKKK